MDIKEEYEVHFTEECIKEIRKIYAYIKENLCAEIDKYRGTKKIYRRIVIDNYVLLYTIDEEKKKVYISHMYYGGSDYINKI